MTTNPMATTAAPAGDEPFRPKIHFTPRRNWINDPNGLVYVDGEYHLFYQYNPHGMEWGHMSWGHAVSTDLAHWRELPVAIPETDQMIFSGSIVVDWDDVSGLGDGTAPPLLAFFTAFDAARGIQSQHLAYSHDRGRTFAHHAGNPIIDLNHADFRDPKVFYHAPSAAWVMAVALAKDHVVQFYRSTNLLDWQLASAFGPAGSTAGQWECPDLIPVPVAGADGETAWVLKVDVDNGFLDGGSGTQYFVGSFDGHAFAIDPVRGDPAGDVVDHGPDFYAAITWAELPATQPGPIWIGWQSNHQSGRLYPTDPWRGAMSLPRRLFLYRDGERLRLGQEPILSQAAGPAGGSTPRVLGAGQAATLAAGMSCHRLTFDLEPDRGAGVTVAFSDEEQVLLTLAWDPAQRQVTFERAPSLAVASPAFHRRTEARGPSRRAGFSIIVDGPLVEMFIDGGRLVYTATLFPAGSMSAQVRSVGGACTIRSLDVAELARTVRHRES